MPGKNFLSKLEVVELKRARPRGAELAFSAFALVIFVRESMLVYSNSPGLLPDTGANLVGEFRRKRLRDDGKVDRQIASREQIEQLK
jgi:hypothetical protein